MTQPEFLEYPDALVAIDDYFERGWTDGLPVVPPTPERVEALLAMVPRDPGQVLARMPPINRECTVEKAAVNAVMAGCLPEHFPVVVAALDAASDPGWQHPYWYILNASTSSGRCATQASSASTRSGVGGKIGSPSVQPRA